MRSLALFEASVERRLTALRERGLHALDAEPAAKRLEWLAARPELRGAPVTPHRLFELLFLEYMRVAQDELPVRSSR